MAYLPSDNPTSLVAWFRMGVGVTESGGLASAWADQSGNGNDLLQATGTNQPAYDGSAILTFDGADNFMKCAAFTLNQPIQISMLINQVSWTGGDRILDGNTATTVLLQQNLITPGIRLFAGSIIGPDANLSVGAFHALTLVANGVSSSILVDTSAPTTGSAGANASGGFTLASQGGGGGLYANIAVKEIILRNVDDATIRAADQQYLIDLENPPAPVADFSGTPTSGTTPLTVAFTDLSTESPTSWLWEKNDGSGWVNFDGTPTDQNPSEIFDVGLWSVRLTASNAAGSDTDTKTDYITATAPASDEDTHDGYKRVVEVPPFDEKRYEQATERGKLRRTIEAIFDPVAPPAPEIVEAIEPYAAVMESGRVRIDWERVEREATLVLRLQAMVAERERAQREFEEDERDVELLLLH